MADTKQQLWLAHFLVVEKIDSRHKCKWTLAISASRSKPIIGGRVVSRERTATDLERTPTAIDHDGPTLMSGEEKTQSGTQPSCTRCGTKTQEILTIDPVSGDPGLVAYECPKCGQVMSVLIPPLRPNARHDRD